MAKDIIAERARFGINPRDPSLPIVTVVERTASESAVIGEKYFEVYTANALGGGFAMMKARGTVAAPGNVLQDDALGSYYFKAYSNGFQNTASIDGLVDAAVVAGQRPASRLEIKTNEANAAPRLVVHVSREGYLGVGTPFNPAIAATRAAHAIHVVASGAVQPYVTAEHYGAAQHARFRIGRARGTFAAPTTVVTGDSLGSYEFFGYTNQWHECSEVSCDAEGTVVAGTTPDSALLFNTTFGGAIQTRMRIFSTGRAALGEGQAQTVTVATANGEGKLWIANNDAAIPLALQRASTDTGSASFNFRKSRGTLAAPATVVNGDELAYIQGNAYTNAWHDNVGAISILVDAAVVAGQRPANRIAFRTGINNAGGPSDRMVIYSGGTVFIGPGTVDTTRFLHVAAPTPGFSIVRFQATGGGATNNVLRLDGGDNAVTGSGYIAFHRPDGTQIGSVTQNAAATVAYNTSSDGRLKADIQDSEMGLSEVLQIRPRRFRFRTDPSNQILHGFIAQELVTVFPEAVTVGATTKDCDCDMGEKGEHDPDCCNSNPWGVDYAKLTPLLVRAVQELEARLAILEGK